MSRSNRQSDCQKPEEATRLVLPAGTPDWITPELVEATVCTWQPYYKTPLTIDDAIEIIRSAGLLFNAFSTGQSGADNSQQSPPT
jgi:hypothetical protein